VRRGVILAACWSVAPFVGYWPLLVLAFVAGLFVVPSFSIVRQALIHAVDESQRRAALSVDSVMVEISFMIGPALGVLLATYAPTSWALFACQMCSVAGGFALWLANPSLRADRGEGVAEVRHRLRTWLTPQAVAVLVTSAATTVVLTGTDVGVIAALRHLQHQSWIGWELGVWGLGSAIGGFLYGALHRSIPAGVLLALLAGLTLPVAFARDAVVIGVLLFVAGIFCAPTVTATVDTLSRVVPERVRGEALGWHGSAMTAGSAIGAPIAGVAIDQVGWQGGFVLPSLLALAVAGAGLFVALGRRPAPAAEEAPALI
jgi:predicted MFS family arabinose efflux permease